LEEVMRMAYQMVGYLWRFYRHRRILIEVGKFTKLPFEAGDNTQRGYQDNCLEVGEN
jgi:hypothetical protein